MRSASRSPSVSGMLTSSWPRSQRATRSGREEAMRPRPKARLFMATSVPFSTIACMMFSTRSGMRPFCQA